MCDPTLISMTANTASSGILASGQSKVNQMEAKSIAKFEAAQLEAMGVLADARANRQERNLRQGMKSAVENNMEAMAVSGLGFGSFESIARGQRKDMSQALGDIAANTDVEKINLRSQSAMAMLGGQMEAAAARMSGQMKINNVAKLAPPPPYEPIERTNWGSLKNQRLQLYKSQASNKESSYICLPGLVGNGTIWHTLEYE